METHSTGHNINYLVNSNTTDPHDKGVGFMISKKAKQSLLEWNPVSPKIITARLNTKFQKTTLIQVYSSTNNADDGEKDDFYNSMRTILILCIKQDIP